MSVEILDLAALALTAVFFALLYLSLIHILRCRRRG